MTIFQLLQTTNLPCVYSHFRTKDSPKAPPFIAYIGSGQDNFKADNTFYDSRNTYQLEYYFTDKDEAKEAEIEKLLLDNGYLYEKSEDTYIEEMGCFVIYYYI